MKNVSSQDSMKMNNDFFNSSTEQLFFETNVRGRFTRARYLAIGVGALILLSAIALISWSIASNYGQNSFDHTNDTIKGIFKSMF